MIGSLNEYESIMHLKEARVQIGFRKRSPRQKPPATTIMVTKVEAEIIRRQSIAVEHISLKTDFQQSDCSSVYR